MADGDVLIATGNLAPNRYAAKFIATGDQAIVIDAWAVARVAAGDTVGTISAWVNIPDITGDYGIISAGDTAAIEFLTLRVTAGKLVVELNDATADKFEHTSTDVVITPHRWHHVAVTQSADTNAPQLYVDGVHVAQTATLGTDNTLWFAALGLTDDASIGAAEEAGVAAQIREFKGGISDVKYWTVTLTADQILQDFRGQNPAEITGTSTDLTDHWDMRDDFVNNITAANNGTAGASIVLVRAYSEFTSRMAFLGQVSADDIAISMSFSVGHCIITKAA